MSGAAGSGDGAEGTATTGSAGLRVKICGLGRRADVEAAAEAGADYAGLVLAESPRRLAPAEAAELAGAARAAGLLPVGVFVDRPVPEVAGLADRLGLAAVQLHGDEDPAACASLRSEGTEVWKAIRPRNREELERLVDRYAAHADALLVEGWSPEAAGGTGTGFPHEWLAGDARPAGLRIVLAGGLDPENVGGAVQGVRPDVVDVSSGVESAPGRKDPGRIRAFVRAARAAAGPADAGRGDDGSGGSDAERGGAR